MEFHIRHVRDNTVKRGRRKRKTGRGGGLFFYRAGEARNACSARGAHTSICL